MEVEDDFYDNCPNLSKQSQENMDADLTLQELLIALMRCTDSAPGSDGIPYSGDKEIKSFLSKMLAIRLLLVKCYDIKMVKSPGCLSIERQPCG